MKQLSLGTLAMTFVCTTLSGLGVIALEAGRMTASSALGAVQFGLICMIALATLTSHRKE